MILKELASRLRTIQRLWKAHLRRCRVAWRDPSLAPAPSMRSIKAFMRNLREEIRSLDLAVRALK